MVKPPTKPGVATSMVPLRMNNHRTTHNPCWPADGTKKLLPASDFVELVLAFPSQVFVGHPRDLFRLVIEIDFAGASATASVRVSLIMM